MLLPPPKCHNPHQRTWKLPRPPHCAHPLGYPTFDLRAHHTPYIMCGNRSNTSAPPLEPHQHPHRTLAGQPYCVGSTQQSAHGGPGFLAHQASGERCSDSFIARRYPPLTQPRRKIPLCGRQPPHPPTVHSDTRRRGPLTPAGLPPAPLLTSICGRPLTSPTENLHRPHPRPPLVAPAAGRQAPIDLAVAHSRRRSLPPPANSTAISRCQLIITAHTLFHCHSLIVNITVFLL